MSPRRHDSILEAIVKPCSPKLSGASTKVGSAANPQTETTHLALRSVRGCEGFSYWRHNYRGVIGLCASNGILFNHESPRRGETFVTRKITRAVAAIKLGLQKELYLGNLEAKRDWGYAPEYVEGMWRILQQAEGDDFVLATNEMHTVREFVEAAFSYADLDWKDYVKYDERYERPAEVDLLIGDASKAKRSELGTQVDLKSRPQPVDADVNCFRADRAHTWELPYVNDSPRRETWCGLGTWHSASPYGASRRDTRASRG